MLNTVFKSGAFALIAASSLSLVACGGDQQPKITPEQMVAYSSDSLDGLDAESSLFVATLDGAQSDSSKEVAAHIKANAERLTPAGCAKGTVGDGKVDVHFVGCAGPRGITGMTGDVTFTFTSNPTTIEVHVAAQGLVVGAVSLSIDSDVHYEVDASGTPSMSVKTGGTAKGALDNEITRSTGESAPYTVSWTDDCLTLDGVVDTTLPIAWDEHVFVGSNYHDGVMTDTAMASVVRCGGKCPASGLLAMGTYPQTNITLDGTATPAYTAQGKDLNESGRTHLACSP